MQIRKRGERPLGIDVHHVARPELGDETPAVIILSSPHRPFRGGTAYQGYAYLPDQDGRPQWEPAGGMHDNADRCLESAIAHARVLRDQDKPRLPRRHHHVIAGLLLLAYELAPNGTQKRENQ